MCVFFAQTNNTKHVEGVEGHPMIVFFLNRNIMSEVASQMDQAWVAQEGARLRVKRNRLNIVKSALMASHERVDERSSIQTARQPVE